MVLLRHLHCFDCLAELSGSRVTRATLDHLPPVDQFSAKFASPDLYFHVRRFSDGIDAVTSFHSRNSRPSGHLRRDPAAINCLLEGYSQFHSEDNCRPDNMDSCFFFRRLRLPAAWIVQTLGHDHVDYGGLRELDRHLGISRQTCSLA